MYLIMYRVMMSGVFHLTFFGHLNKKKEINFLYVRIKWLLRSS